MKQEPEKFEVVELDDNQLDDVAGGMSEVPIDDYKCTNNCEGGNCVAGCGGNAS